MIQQEVLATFRLVVSIGIFTVSTAVDALLVCKTRSSCKMRKMYFVQTVGWSKKEPRELIVIDWCHIKIV